MEILQQQNKIPDLQERMLQEFLLRVDPLLQRGFEGIDGKTLKSKYTEFFLVSSEVNFERRLSSAYVEFNNWLEGGDWRKMDRVAVFCMPILRSIAEYSLEISERKKREPGDVVELRK